MNHVELQKGDPEIDMFDGLAPYPSDFNKIIPKPLLTSFIIIFKLCLLIDFSIFHVDFCMSP